MIKITEIETLLNMGSKAEITIRDVSAEDIKELARYYGSDINSSSFFDSTSFKRGDVTITLQSEAKDINAFPPIDFEFLNIRKETK